MTRTDLCAAHTRRTRAAIRAAALTLTRERGYAAMTVDDVAALAGVSRRTVFNHFSSKADLLLIGPDAPEPEAVEAFVAGTGGLLEDLGALLASGVQSLEPERTWLLAFPEVVRDNPEVERAVHERFEAVERVLEEAACRRLGLPATDARVIAVVSLCVAVQKGAVRLWASACTRPDCGDPGVPGGADGGSGDEPRPPADPDGRRSLGLADAVRAVTAAMGEVVAVPGTEGASRSSPAG